MSKEDTEFLLEQWKELCVNLISVNRDLKDLVYEQQKIIIKLQDVQTSPLKQISEKDYGTRV